MKDIPHSKGHYFERNFLASEALWALNATAIRVLFVFYMKTRIAGKIEAKKMNVKRGFIKNNDNLVFSYSEAKKYGISKNTFTRAIDSLIEHGFLEMAHQSENGEPNRYFLSEAWKKYNQKPGFFKPDRPRKKRTKQIIGSKTRWTKKITPKNSGDISP